MSNFQLADFVVLVHVFLGLSLLGGQVLFLIKHIQSASLDPKLIRRVEVLAITDVVVIGLLVTVILLTEGAQTMVLVYSVFATIVTIVACTRARHLQAAVIFTHGIYMAGQFFVLIAFAVEYMGNK